MAAKLPLKIPIAWANAYPAPKIKMAGGTKMTVKE
jgi:hypothetical protein